MNVNKIKFIFISALIFFVGLLIFIKSYSASRFNIVSIESFKEVQKALNSADEGTLVLFDIDDTLIVSPSKNFWKSNFLAHKKEIEKIADTAFKRTDKNKKYLLSKRLAKEVPLIIEAIVPEMIKTLQERKVEVLALSRFSTGTMGVIRDFPKWRYDKLKEVGINFSVTKFPDIILKTLYHDDKGFYPVFYKGILLTNRSTKGAVLGAFLDYMHYKPKRIIFFDDDREQVKLVASEIYKRKILFEGYVYNGSMHMASHFDANIISIQYNHLVDHEEWLTDEEAKALLER
ncbi:DUF2608 domain-containing protein [Candidatus Babeliales bacterium]|nr:DUF2608 domain-containing protein [Candidatus Babeliales bacterium]